MKRIIMLAAALTLLAACEKNNGPETLAEVKTVTIDATDYSKWTYLNLHSGDAVTLDYRDTDAIPAAWDIAVHRYDAKTNGSKVAETASAEFTDISAAGLSYAADVWTENEIIVDMSGMMAGKIEYAASYRNETLSGWINVDTHSMPPVYEMSGKVYIIQLSDGTSAALRLDNYMNAAGQKGYLTISYIYPFKI